MKSGESVLTAISMPFAFGNADKTSVLHPPSDIILPPDLNAISLRSSIIATFRYWLLKPEDNNLEKSLKKVVFPPAGGDATIILGRLFI